MTEPPTVTHELKTNAVYWDMVARGEKLFELRFNDRCFQKGDILKLCRTNPEYPRETDGRYILARITCVISGHWLTPNNVALGFYILEVH